MWLGRQWQGNRREYTAVQCFLVFKQSGVDVLGTSDIYPDMLHPSGESFPGDIYFLDCGSLLYVDFTAGLVYVYKQSMRNTVYTEG